jgi:hypothetical protein
MLTEKYAAPQKIERLILRQKTHYLASVPFSILFDKHAIGKVLAIGLSRGLSYSKYRKL